VTYADTLRALADELRAVGEMPAEQAMLALNRLVDFAAHTDGAFARLRQARQDAARQAVAAAGSQAALARKLGLAEMTVSRAFNGGQPGRRAERRAASY